MSAQTQSDAVKIAKDGARSRRRTVSRQRISAYKSDRKISYKVKVLELHNSYGVVVPRPDNLRLHTIQRSGLQP